MNGKNPYGNIGRENYWQAIRRWFLHCHLTCISLVILAVICATTILAPVMAPYNPDAIVGPFGALPSAGFLLGIDQIGRSMFSRPLYVTRISLLVGVLATVVSTVIGVSLRLPGEYFGGWLGITIIRFTDMVMSLPHIPLVLVAATIFEPGLWSIILILGFVDWPDIVRLVRGSMLSLRETNFVKSSIVAGMPTRRILSSEILPNTVAPILVYITSVIALSMLDEASLSFLGMGVQSPIASLSSMLNSTQSLTAFTKRPQLWIPPGLPIAVLVVAVNFVGDVPRGALDPSAVLNLGGTEPDAEDQDTEDQETTDSV